MGFRENVVLRILFQAFMDWDFMTKNVFILPYVAL